MYINNNFNKNLFTAKNDSLHSSQPISAFLLILLIRVKTQPETMDSFPIGKILSDQMNINTVINFGGEKQNRCWGKRMI